MDNQQVPYIRPPRNNLVRHTLGDKQLEILDLMVFEELLPEQIASKLSLSLKTIRWHLDNIRQNYNTTTTSQAVVKYIKELDNWYDLPRTPQEKTGLNTQNTLK